MILWRMAAAGEGEGSNIYMGLSERKGIGVQACLLEMYSY